MTKTILKAHKIRLYPTDEQQANIDHTLDCCRFAFNHMLARQQKIYQRRGELVAQLHQITIGGTTNES